MNQKELIKLCLNFDDAIDSYPFEDDYVVLRHKSNNKWFGLIFHLNNKLCINLKCNPIDSVFLREEYKSIKPAWHMNKKHWNTIEVNNISKELLENLIKISFDLTKPKK